MRRVINPFPRPEPAAETEAVPPNFEAAQPLQVKLPEGERWVKPSDFTGSRAVIGRVRARFGAAVAAFDADGDGRLDLFLTSAVVGPKGIHDALLLNKGDGRFEDASASFGLPNDRASLGVAAADFDADRHIDLFLTGVGDNRLLRNRDGKTFEDISSTLKPAGPPALSLMARWLDLDQDGDLDLYVVNYCAAEHADKAFLDSGDPPPGLANAVYRNDGQPDPVLGATIQGRTPVATAYGKPLSHEGLDARPDTMARRPCARRAAERPHRDRPARHRQRPRPRPGARRRQGAAGRHPQRSTRPVPRSCHSSAADRRSKSPGILATDFDADGRTDLVAACSNGRVLAWRNIDRADHRGSDQADLRVLADQRRQLAIGAGHRPRPRRLARPARTARRHEQARRSALAGLGTQRRESLRGRDLAAWPREPRSRRADGRRSGRRPSARHPGHPTGRSPRARPRNLGNGQHWLALAARRALAGQARADADQLARDRNPRARRRAGAPRHLRPHDARDRPRPVDRPGRARPRPARSSRPGPSPLARRRHAVRAQCRGQPEARPGREQPQDRQLPGTFHVERQALRLHRRLPRRRRPRLPGRPGRLQPARPRRGDRHHGRPAPAQRRRLPPLGHRADGRGRLPRSPDARRRRSPARRLVHSRRAVRSRRAPTDRRAAGLANRRSSRFAPPTSTAAT